MISTLIEPTPITANDLFSGYASPAGVHDELLAAPGQLRPAWQQFAAAMNGLGADELARRWEQAQRLVHENGITFNVYSEGQDRSRPWELDALPLLMPAGEWQSLSAALVQRAQLLNLILADLYGPQKLLSGGLLPAELLYAHPGFMRACHGQRMPHDCFLHIYAADLARSPDGQWWVAGDRTDTPSGAGYALENRIVISRMLPGVFHDCQVERLAPHFMALQESLRELAPHHRENPRIVLLSQGPKGENYFEDAYLSRYLGYTLVESGDLAVRDSRVLLKTLGGLLPVDVILRRLRESDCDPLELSGASRLGVPGLLQAARAGNVVVANALGSGLVESPAFMGFLPVLCRELLGEDLKLPSVATWWCGEAAARQYVLDKLDTLVIRPAFRLGGRPSISADELSRKGKQQLADMIKARPELFVGQEHVARSCAPVWTPDALKPAHVALRTYAVANDGSYSAMPGGLSRVSASAERLDMSILAGEGSKDLWVLSEGPVSHVSLLQPPGQTVELHRSGSELPSRVADNLYWLGRQVERAEGAARLLRTVFARLASEWESQNIPELPVLLRVLACQGQIEPGYVVDEIKTPLPAIERVLPTIVFDASQPGSLRETLTAMHRTASIVRDRISIDSWRIVNHIDQDFERPRRRGHIDPSEVLDMLNQLIIDLASFSGLVMESMTRTQGWRFLDIGRRLERAMYTISLLQSALVRPVENERPVLEALLEVADSSMTYRSRYLASLLTAPVLDLLLTDETNPRSVAYQLAALSEHIENLPRDRSNPQRGPEQRLIMSTLHSIRMADVAALCNAQRSGERTQLDSLLSRQAAQLPKLSNAISNKYLIHAGPPRQLAEIRPE
jgi:uncharacterized circularly permuted ATP-grasp superfamily protein/uncharacterized alpha-E superfamily protein